MHLGAHYNPPQSSKKQAVTLFTVAKVWNGNNLTVHWRWIKKVWKEKDKRKYIKYKINYYSALKKGKGNISICKNMDEAGGHDAKWKKHDRVG